MKSPYHPKAQIVTPEIQTQMMMKDDELLEKTVLKRYSQRFLTPVTHQQVLDHSKSGNAPTPIKYRLFLEDVPSLEVLEKIKLQIKICIDKKLFWNIKFYDSQDKVLNVVGYVFQDGMDGSTIREELERT